MIKIKATLQIKKLNSRFGAFGVADLITDVGQFKVKDALLDQFETGEYQGTVWISEIYLAQYISYGKAVVEMRARLHDVQIQSHAALKTTAEQPEPDPIDEDQVKPAGKARLPAHSPDAQESEPRRLSSEEVDLDQLFGDEVAAMIRSGGEVKLDKTVDRGRFRQQTQVMAKTLGYMFRAQTQSWFPKT